MLKRKPGYQGDIKMRWKWILGIFAAVVVVLLVVVYFIAASYDYNSLKPLITNTAKEFTGRALIMAGDVDLKFGLPPTLEVNDVAFQNAPWGSQPQMASVKHLQVKVSLLPLLRGNVTVNRLILVESQFLLEVNKSGKSNLDFDVARKEPSPKAEEKTGTDSQTEIELEKVEIKGAKIAYKDHRTGQTETVELASLNLKKPLFGSGADIDVQGSYNKTPFRVKGNIGLITQALTSGEKWPLKLEVQAVKTKVSVEGSIKDLMTGQGIDLKLDAEGEDLAQFETLTGKPLPVKGPFRLAGHVVSPSEKEMKVSDLLIVLGESQIQGTVNVTRAAKRPLVDAKLTSKKLDLRPVLAKNETSRESQKKNAGAKKDRVFSAQPFDLGALQKFDAKISLRVDQTIGLISAIENYHTEINLQDGRLTIKPMTGDVGGGKFSATLDLVTQANTARLKSRITAQKINLGEMLKKMDISQDIEGTLELDIDLAGSGNSVAALMAGLNGYFIASMGKGKLPVKYLNLVGADLSSSILEIVNPFEEKVDRADINCAVCDFHITKGLASGDAIIIDDPKKTLISHGTLNLASEELDFDIQTKPKGGIGTKDTVKVNVSLSSVTKPFKLSGTLANPSVGISAVRTATLIGKVLFLPGGIPSLFVSGSVGDQNPCVEAVKKVKEQAAKGKAKSDGKTTQPNSEAKKKEGLGSKILNLFSKPKE
jgi:uncharacterized protein involved in outer membrane biogenesis